jgi:LPXTG-motif cell wall-anchored protein
LLTCILVSFMIGLTTLGDKDSSWILAAGLLLVSAGLLMVFIKYESKTPVPILNLQLFKYKPFLALIAYIAVGGISNFGISSFLPFYMVSLYHTSTLISGAILTPRSILIIIGASLASIFIVKWGYRRPIMIGMACVLIAVIILGIQPQDINLGNIQISGISFIIIAMAFAGLFGASDPAINNVFIEMMPDKVATMMGIRGMFYQLGGAIGISGASIILQLFNQNLSTGFAIVFFGIAAFIILILPMIPIMTTYTVKTSDVV